MLALLTYDARDPGPFNINSNPGQIFNVAERPGAWLADFLFGLMGYCAYGLPVVLVVMGLVLAGPAPWLGVQADLAERLASSGLTLLA